MSCQHIAGDPACSSHPKHQTYLRELKELRERLNRASRDTPDSERFEVVDMEEVEGSLILTVLYPSCASCSYEGRKFMFFRDTMIRDVVFWKKIDPHFRAKESPKHEAPSPDARFPASPQGLEMARALARSVLKSKP